MASYDCCTSREPPSPDGAAPRPVSSPPKPRKNLSKEPVQAPSWSLTSRFSKAEDEAELRAIFEENRSDEEATQDAFPSKKSTGTLNAVKTKLRRHLSRESGLSKRNSRSSFSNSDETNERIRELKIKLKERIKAELSSEVGYDEDAKSITVPAAHLHDSIQQMGHESENLKGIPEASSAPGKIFFLPLNSNQSMDNNRSIQDTQDASSPCNQPYQVNSAVEESKTEVGPSVCTPKSNTSLQRRHSSADLTETYRESFDKSPSNTRRSSSGICMPPAPILLPQRLPSIVDTATCLRSWRLSFAAESRATQLRSLSHEHTISTETYPDTLSPAANAAKWLHGQGRRMNSQVLTDSDEKLHKSEELASHNELCSAEKEFGGVDGNAEPPQPLRLHEMQISRNLLSYASSPQLSSWGSRSQRCGSSSISHGSESPRPRRCRRFSGSKTLGPKSSTTWEAVLRERASSFYPSTDDSHQITPESSRFNLASLLTSRRRKAEAWGSDDKDNNVTRNGPERDRLITHTEPNTPDVNLEVSVTGQSRRLTTDSSTVASETDSLQQREAELNVIEARFTRSKQKRSSTSPVESKFIEEFGHLRVGPYQRHSILSALQIPKIARLTHRSYDGENSQELIDELDAAGAFCQIPRGGFGRKAVKAPPVASRLDKTAGIDIEETEVDPFSVNDTETATSMWDRALKSNNQGVLNKSTSFVPGASFLGGDLFGGDKGKSKEGGSGRSSERSSTQRVAKRKTTSNDTWARFPSHTRGERSLTAGLPDNVEGKDFAIKQIVDGEAEYFTHPRKRHFYHRRHAQDKHHLTMSQRMQERVRFSFFKFISSPNIPTNATIDGRRGSLTMQGKIEDPELEIIALPLDEEVTGELANLEGDIAAEMRREERIRRMWKIEDFADGSGEFENEQNTDWDAEYQNLEVSIADPRFYEDCLIGQTPEEFDGESVRSTYSEETIKLEDLLNTDRDTLKRTKHKTWSGSDRASKQWLESLALRKSTLNFTEQLERMEVAERARVIRSAEEAWG